MNKYSIFHQHNCRVCESSNLNVILSLGSMPPSNRYLTKESVDEKIKTYDLSLGICLDCDTIQLVDYIPIAEIVPRHAWLTYNEPEGHLDCVVDMLIHKKIITGSSRILGMTYKDMSTIDRLISRGFLNSYGIHKSSVFKMDQTIGLESIQKILSNDKNISLIKTDFGLADLVIVRHMVEHAESSKKLLENIKLLLNPGGYVLIEVPCCNKMLRHNNHPFIWEEHFSYFNIKSMNSVARILNARITFSSSYSYNYEDSLVVLMQFNDCFPVNLQQSSLRYNVNNLRLLNNFSESFVRKKRFWHNYLKKETGMGKRIGIFGAGHLAVKFLNFYDLSRYIDCIIDDNPFKIGKLLPGSLLEIVPSSDLNFNGINCCISTLSPESDIKARPKLKNYFDRGGKLIHAFARQELNR